MCFDLVLNHGEWFGKSGVLHLWNFDRRCEGGGVRVCRFSEVGWSCEGSRMRRHTCGVVMSACEDGKVEKLRTCVF